jgi:hypothetical protein
MTLISMLLMIVWMAGIMLDFTLGGLIHVLALGAVMIVFMSGNQREHPTCH